MSGEMLLLVFFLCFAGAGVWYTSQVKKNYLGELEESLTLQNFSMKGFGGHVLLTGGWREKQITIECEPFTFNYRPAFLHISIAAGFGFNMVVRPGQLIAKQKVAEDESFRPWRNPRLTDEEKAFIAKRSGVEQQPEQPAAPTPEVQKFIMSTDNDAKANEFMRKEERLRILENLFLKDFAYLRISHDQISISKCPYSIKNDLDKTAVRDFLTQLNKLME